MLREPCDYAVILVHYHLNAGGVTRIIEQQSRALQELGIPHLVLCGDKQILGEVPHLILPELQFTSDYSKGVADRLEKQIREIVENRLPNKAIFHFHNHAIGLNPYYQKIVWSLSQDYRTVLQLHDFIEDGREFNLHNITDKNHLYPKAEHIQYCNINSRDLAILQSAGTTPTLLPNSYREIGRNPAPTTDWIFYPIQALRRKNIGEILLLSLASPKPYRYAIAATPSDQLEVTAYWQEVSEQLQLDIAFDVVDQIPPLPTAEKHFCSWYEHASRIVSTSIQEGFGMVFIEPIYFQTPFFGRDLPEITRDIKQQGVDHPHTYQSILVNIEGFAPTDFANYTEAEQTRLIRLLAQDRSLLKHIRVQSKQKTTPLLSFLNTAINDDSTPALSSINPWSTQRLKENLTSLYKQLSDKKISTVTSLEHDKIYTFFAQ